MEEIYEKARDLREIIRDCGRLAVAFSAGVDSTFLLRTAHDVLGGNVLALTASAASFQRGELAAAKTFCEKEQIPQVIAEIDQFAIEGFDKNPANRCYLCKKVLFSRLFARARERGFPILADGTNADDATDFRPGARAIRELGVRSPLAEAGLSKAEIRRLSREAGLDTWAKPANACLATRFPVGECLSAEKFALVEQAEEKLHDLGAAQTRVRVHGNLARIELPPEDWGLLLDHVKDVSAYFHELGFRYVTLNLDGYQTGSMNQGLP